MVAGASAPASFVLAGVFPVAARAEHGPDVAIGSAVDSVLGAPPVAVVTGACGGIGGEVAYGLIEEGFEVVCACRTVAQSQATAKRLGSGAIALEVPCDLADLRSVKAYAEALLERGSQQDPERGSVEVLILAAGVIGPSLSVGRTAQGHELNFGVNHLGHFQLVRSLLPALRASEGVPGSSSGARVISVSSTAALDVPNPF
eukprot:gene19174-22920_t